MLKLFSCLMCKYRDRKSSSENSHCFALFQNTLALKQSLITDCYDGFV